SAEAGQRPADMRCTKLWLWHGLHGSRLAGAGCGMPGYGMGRCQAFRSMGKRYIQAGYGDQKDGRDQHARQRSFGRTAHPALGSVLRLNPVDFKGKVGDDQPIAEMERRPFAWV